MGATRAEIIRASVLLLALIVLFLVPVLRPGWMPSASGMLHNWSTFTVDPEYQSPNDLLWDVATQHEPWTRYARQRLSHGELPLWNPHQAAGVPFIANMQSAVYSPFTWIVYALGDCWGPIARAVLILYLSGILAFLHLRGLGVGERAAMLGMVGWTFSGGLSHWLFWRSSLFGFLLPGTLYLTDRAFARPSRSASWSLALAALVALGITAGHTDRVVLCAVAAGINLIYRLLSSELRWSGRLRVTGLLISGGLFGALLSACALLPLMEYMRLSAAWEARAGTTVTLPFATSALMFVPDLFGNRALPFGVGWVASWTNDCEALTGVVGLTLLVLATLGLRRGPGPRRAYLAMAVLAALLAYGAWPVRQLVQHVPPLDRMAIGRFSAMLAYSLVVLGALSLQQIIDQRIKPLSHPSLIRLAALVALGAALVAWNLLDPARFLDVPGLRQWWIGCIAIAVITLALCLLLLNGAFRGRGWCLAALIVLVFLETGARWSGFTPHTPAQLYYPRTTAVERLQEVAGRGRFVEVGPSNSFPPNLATVYGLRDVKVYDNLEILKYRVLFDEGQDPLGPGQMLLSFDPDVLSVLGVRAIISIDGAPPQMTSGRTNALHPAFQADGVEIWDNREALPRAFFVDSALFTDNAQDVYSRDEHGLLARRAVFLYGERQAQHNAPPQPSGAVDWLRDDPEVVALEVSAPRAGYLVLLDTLYPGWQAFVDGEQAQILRADLAFRAVEIEAGVHKVLFQFRPLSVYLGLLISSLAAALWLIALLAILHRRRSAEHQSCRPAAEDR
ncbi:MAG: hypothetical protein P9M14_11040 [Candidatus Alcyoniella australis]|nr:hypothetical protein [Candidatus Alcyoniella australis]